MITTYTDELARLDQNISDMKRSKKELEHEVGIAYNTIA